VDNRLQLPLDEADASPMAYKTDDGSVWTLMLGSERRRIARVTRNADGGFHLDEGHLQAAHALQGFPNVC